MPLAQSCVRVWPAMSVFVCMCVCVSVCVWLPVCCVCGQD